MTRNHLLNESLAADRAYRGDSVWRMTMTLLAAMWGVPAMRRPRR